MDFEADTGNTLVVSTTTWRIGDHLGSLSSQVDKNGNVLSTANLSPYGQAVYNSGNDPFLFTEHERDSETGDDATMYRQYSSTQGRWVSPDPYMGSYSLTDPQSMNRYAYVTNRPVNAKDEDGLDCGGSSAIPQPIASNNCDMYNNSCSGGGGYTYVLDGTPVSYTELSNYLSFAYPTQIFNSSSGMYIGTLVPHGPDQYGPSTPNYVQVTGFLDTVEWTFMSGNTSDVAGGGGGGYSVGGGNKGPSLLKSVFNDVKNCIANVGGPAFAHDMNPFGLGIGTAADVISQMSLASLAGAASRSIQQGLTVPLRSSIIRAGVAGAETLGKVSGVLTAASVVYGLADAVVAEYKQCQ